MRSARVLGVLLALGTALPADAREFRSSDIYPFDYPTVQAVVQVDKAMRERSGGKLGITMLGYDDRDSENYTAAQVRNGQLDMARINLAALNSLAPSFMPCPSAPKRTWYVSPPLPTSSRTQPSVPGLGGSTAMAPSLPRTTAFS